MAARRASAKTAQSHPVTDEWCHRLRNIDIAGTATAKKGVSYGLLWRIIHYDCPLSQYCRPDLVWCSNRKQ